METVYTESQKHHSNETEFKYTAQNYQQCATAMREKHQQMHKTCVLRSNDTDSNMTPTECLGWTVNSSALAND